MRARTELSILVTVLAALAAAPTSRAGKDVLVEKPQLDLPQRGSIAGSLSRLAFGAADLARGAYSLPLPIDTPADRGPLLAGVVPGYSAEHGVTEWGVGWQTDLAIRRHRIAGEVDFTDADGFTSPWGRLVRGDDGSFYPAGMSQRVRLRFDGVSWVAVTADGTRYTFEGADAVTTVLGTYAWMLSRVENVLGDSTTLHYTRNASGRAFLSEVLWGGRFDGTQYRMRLEYETLPAPFDSFVSGEKLVLDRRVRGVVQEVLSAGAYVERWRYDLAHQTSPTGPAFYLVSSVKTYRSGESEPPVTWAYDLGVERLASATLERAPALDPFLASYGETATEPDRAAMTDLEQNGLTDLETHDDQTLVRQTEGGYVFEPLPAASGSEHPLCRPSPSSFNRPRHLARMHGAALEPHVVATRALLGDTTRVVVCDRLGFALYNQVLEGAWHLGPTTRLADLDLDQRPDLLRVGYGAAAVLRNVSADPTAIGFLPGPTSSLEPRVTPEASWVLDFNGDGRADLVVRHSGGILVWRGVGGGRFEPTGTAFPFLLASGLPVTDLAAWELSHGDFNNDGLSDAILSQGDQVLLFTNRGASFVEVDVPALGDIPFSVGYPVIADLSGSGNEQVILPDGSLGYTIQLTAPSTGLLLSADDGKGTVVRFEYGRVKPVPGVRHRYSILTAMTVASSGYDVVTYRYAYDEPVWHTVGRYLVGFAQARKESPFLTQRVSFHNDDDVSGVILEERDVDARAPDLERFERRDLQPASFHGVRWMRARSAERGLTTGDGAASVSMRTDFLAWERELCPVLTETHGPHGTLREETTLTTVLMLDPELSCLASSERQIGTHPDARFDFAHRIDIERDTLGRLVKAWQVGPDGKRQLLQAVTYDTSGRISAITAPGQGRWSFGYDALGLIARTVSPESVVQTILSRDPVSDQVEGARLNRGGGAWSSYYGYDEKERLARSWDTLSGTTSGNPALQLSYVFATDSTPAQILESRLVDAVTGALAEQADLLAADGERIAAATRQDTGWALSRITRVERASLARKSFARDPLASLSGLSHDALLSGATLLGETTTTGAGEELTAWVTVQSNVVTQRAFARAIVEGELVTSVTENGNFVTRTGAGADGAPLWFEDQAGVAHVYAYDAIGRLRRVSTPSGDQTVTYDAFGRPVLVEREGLARIEYAYDGQTGLMTERRDLGGAGTLERRTTYERDTIGREIRTTELVVPTGERRVIERLHDGWIGPITSLPGQRGFETLVTIGPFSRLTLRRTDGKPTSITWTFAGWRSVEQTFAYHAGGQERRVSTSVKDAGGLELVATTKEYGYDARGRLQTVTVNGVTVAELDHDAEGRVSALQLGDERLAFTFDAATRARRGWTTSGTATPTGVSWLRNARGLVRAETFTVGATALHRQYGYNSRRWLVSSSDELGGVRYTYDPSGLMDLPAGAPAPELDPLGRVVAAGDRTAHYGPSGMLEKAWRGPDVLRFVYDENGERVLKLVNDVPVAATVAGAWLDADTLVEPVEVAGVMVGVLENGAFRRVPFDARGSRFADEAGALDVASPYGLRAAWGPLAEAIDWVEKGYDRDLGLVRMGVRDYDPRLGRFWTPDPLFLGQIEKCVESPSECNLYGYAKNDPVSFVDPTGTDAKLRGAMNRCSEKDPDADGVAGQNKLGRLEPYAHLMFDLQSIAQRSSLSVEGGRYRLGVPSARSVGSRAAEQIVQSLQDEATSRLATRMLGGSEEAATKVGVVTMIYDAGSTLHGIKRENDLARMSRAEREEKKFQLVVRAYAQANPRSPAFSSCLDCRTAGAREVFLLLKFRQTQEAMWRLKPVDTDPWAKIGPAKIP